MPYKPKVPCRHPGCAALVEPGSRYCAAHKALHPEEQRRAEDRGYTQKWRKASRRYLQGHPLCVQCLKRGRYVRATVVDHIVPHRGDQVLFWDQDNWQALCKPCHDRKTGLEDSHPLYTY